VGSGKTKPIQSQFSNQKTEDRNQKTEGGEYAF
jgi:hypothetical protein